MKNISPSALFQRASLLAGNEAMKRIATTRVIIFGLGGVGSWCAESLVRTGVQKLTLVDSDVICVTNVNRQLQATAQNVGAVKVDELRTRLLQINPQAEIEAVRMAYDETTCSRFNLAEYDYVIDAIDSLKNKILLIEKCIQCGVKFFSSMGAASRLDPTQVRTGTLDKTTVCPLARVVRQGLRQRNIPLNAVPCVYSVEPALPPKGKAHCGSSACLCAPPKAGEIEVFPDWCATKAQINGAVVHVTAVFGFTLASMVIRDLVEKARSMPGDDFSKLL